MKLVQYLSYAAKFLAALSGSVAVAVSVGLIDGTAQRWTVGVIAVATAFVTYFVPNGPKPGATAPKPPAV